MGHNPNRTAWGFPNTGENLYWSWSSNQRDFVASAAVTAWFEEVKDLARANVLKFNSVANTGVVGHYT